MAFQITTKAADKLRKTLEEATVDPSTRIPGVVTCIVNTNGEQIFCESSGQRTATDSRQMGTNAVFWLASATKLVAAIAAMQLVEKGVLRLDDSDQVEELLPALKSIPVLVEDADGTTKTVSKQRGITLRHLLTHTSGFGYAGWVKRLHDWIMIGSQNVVDFEQPLVFQPGEDWEYGFSIEWVSLLIEKASGQRMSQYMSQHIFDPINVQDISLFPDREMRERAVKINQRDLATGVLQEGTYFMEKNLFIDTEEAKEKMFQSAAGGLFATAPAFCDILATILNNGTSPATGIEILKPQTVAMMFENQIPQFPNFARKGMPNFIPTGNYYIRELYPSQPHHEPQGWGLSFMLTLEPTTQGRGAYTASWSGMGNCYWWIDRSKGVAGFICTQILPWGDPLVLELCSDIETIVYSVTTQFMKLKLAERHLR